MNSLPSPSPVFEKWNLRKDFVFLNHGSFGATPIFIKNRQREYIDRLEAEPVDFSVRQLYPLYQASKDSLANFVGTSSDNIYFVPNTTIGINHILHNIHDKNCNWLTTNHAYGACLNAFNKIADIKNCTVTKINIPYPISSEDEILESIQNGIKSDTRIVMMDYITSASAIVFPIKRIIELLHSKNIKVIVDGAHAPGMVDFNIDELEADYFVGNCHKWICSPKGSAFVYVNPKHQSEYKPVLYSFYNDKEEDKKSHWSNQFAWEGTRDYSPYLSVKDAIEYMPTLIEGGWTQIKKQNRDLAINAAKMIADKLEVKIPAPESMLGSIVNIPLWDDKIPERKFQYYTEVKNILFDEFRIEVPCVLFPEAPKQYVRIAAQLYNSMEQYEYLADCLLKIRERKS